MRRSTKSVDEPPTCKPTLAPPTLYIAGADHLPPKLLPVRQSIGPRPPLPPMPMPNFFTLGRTITQLAFASTSEGTLLLLTISCKTWLAFCSVCSSFSLSPPHPGKANRITMDEMRQKDRILPRMRLSVAPNTVLDMAF